MADLDDFFAKKDRKKSKAKKFTTTEEIVRKIKETGKKLEKSKKDKINIISGNLGPDIDDLAGNNEEDEEWKEFKEEKKDYTGLKIQNLTLQDLDDIDINDGDNDGEPQESDSNELNSQKKGPWKVVENVDNQVKLEPEKIEKQPAPAGKSYVPPALRHQNQNRERFTSNPGKSEAPDITNQKYFPTLSAAANESSASWSKKKQEPGFEEVRNSRSHSSRSDPTRTPQALPIENKFDLLETENS